MQRPVLQSQPREVAEEHPQALEGVRSLEHLLWMPAWDCPTSPPQPRCGWWLAAAAASCRLSTL